MPSLPHHHAGRAARRQGAAPAGRGATRAAPPGSRAPAGRGAEGCAARDACLPSSSAPRWSPWTGRGRRRPSRRTRSGGQRRPTTPSASHRSPVVPRAIAMSADCASLDLVGKFTQDSNSELQVAVNPASQGLVSKIGLEVTNISCSLILHWGVLRPDKRDWILPSRQPDGTTVYKSRALRTPFVKGIDDKVITVVFREGGTEFTAIVVDVGSANNSEPVLLLTEV